MRPTAPKTTAELLDALSTPSRELVEMFGSLDGPITILGAGGKMGPSLTLMARRAMDLADGGRRRAVIAVSRWSDEAVAHQLDDAGVQVETVDLRYHSSMERLQYTPNVIFMAGQKFGTAGDPADTWHMNTIVPAWCGEHFAGATQVVFSTGNVYPLTPISGHGASEATPLAPVGEYAMSCLGRERVMTALGTSNRSPVALYRLNYACVIWQRDANDIALRLLTHAAVPAVPVNVTGLEVHRVRALATALGDRLGVAPQFTGDEAPDALLSDARALRGRFGDTLDLMPLETLLDWTVEWVRDGRPLLGKATKFEVRDGKF